MHLNIIDTSHFMGCLIYKRINMGLFSLELNNIYNTVPVPAKRPSHTSLIKAMINAFLCPHWISRFLSASVLVPWKDCKKYGMRNRQYKQSYHFVEKRDIFNSQLIFITHDSIFRTDWSFYNF